MWACRRPPQRYQQPSHVPGSASPARCSAGLLERAKFWAVLTRAICENACGKLPTSRLLDISYSSESRPTSLRKASKRSNIRRVEMLGAGLGAVHDGMTAV